jgi:hypothetical protein
MEAQLRLGIPFGSIVLITLTFMGWTPLENCEIRGVVCKKEVD